MKGEGRKYRRAVDALATGWIEPEVLRALQGGLIPTLIDNAD